MKIIRHDDHALELAGIPGDSAAIVVPLGFAVVGGLAIGMSRLVHSAVPLIAGIVMVSIGLILLIRSLASRERLALDLRTCRGRHHVRTFLASRGKVAEFAFDRVAGVEFTRSYIQTPGRHPGPGSEVWTARLLLSGPRRAIVLAETQGGSEQSIRSIAEATARALGVDLIDQSADDSERILAHEIGAPLGARSLAEMSFGPPPDGARVKLSVQSADERVELEWKTVGGPALPVIALIVIGVFVLLSTAMALEATGILPVLSWLTTGSGAAKKPASPGISFALFGMSAALWALWLGILQLWLWSGRRLTITPESVTYAATSPLARLLSLVGGRSAASRWSIPTSEVRSVRTREDAIEIRGPERTHRCLIHLPADGEPAWIAKQVRSAVQVLGQSLPEAALEPALVEAE